MHGNKQTAGAVTGITTVKNPITLARKIMEESKHVFFAGDGAERFADEVGVERVDPEYFFTERRYEQLQRALKETSANPQTPDRNASKMGTVGCVALDKDGNLVAGTSTGGLTNKQFGRVGDVPVIGAGTYANELVAVSATGWGEKIILNVAGHELASYMEFTGASLHESMDRLLNEVMNPKEAGFIAVDKYGNISMGTNTGSLTRAAADSEGNKVIGIWDDELVTSSEK